MRVLAGVNMSFRVLRLFFGGERQTAWKFDAGSNPALTVEFELLMRNSFKTSKNCIPIIVLSTEDAESIG
jgi:hypothetical protein